MSAEFDDAVQLREQLKRANARTEQLQATVDVTGGKFCMESRNVGKDACGCCAWCVANARAEIEELREQLKHANAKGVR